MLSMLPRPDGRLHPVRSALLLGIAGVVVLFSNVSSVTDTVSSVSSSRPVAAIQNAIHNGQHLVNDYAAGSAAQAAAAIRKASRPLAASSTAHAIAKPNKPHPKRYIVLPATAPNPNLCRTVFSLLINGYGPPTIVSFFTSTATCIYSFKWLIDTCVFVHFTRLTCY